MVELRRLKDLHVVIDGFPEQDFQAQHADHLAVFQHRQIAKPFFRHEHQTMINRIVTGRVDRALGHHRFYRKVYFVLIKEYAAGEIALGKDADQTIAVKYCEGADIMFSHDPQSIQDVRIKGNRARPGRNLRQYLVHH